MLTVASATMSGCDLTNQYAICAWGYHYSGSEEEGALESVPVSEHNLLLQVNLGDGADASTNEQEAQLEDKLRELMGLKTGAAAVFDRVSHWIKKWFSSDDPEAHGAEGAIQHAEEGCKLFEEYFPTVGLDGILKVINSIAVSNNGDSDWNHFVGVWAYNKARRLALIAGGGRQIERRYTRDLVEIVASTRLGGAPLHSVIWSAVLQLEPATQENVWQASREELCWFVDLSVDL